MVFYFPGPLTWSSPGSARAPGENLLKQQVFMSLYRLYSLFVASQQRQNQAPTAHGKLEKVGESEWSGKVRGNIFCKSQGK